MEEGGDEDGILILAPWLLQPTNSAFKTHEIFLVNSLESLATKPLYPSFLGWLLDLQWRGVLGRVLLARTRVFLADFRESLAEFLEYDMSVFACKFSAQGGSPFMDEAAAHLSQWGEGSGEPLHAK